MIRLFSAQAQRATNMFLYRNTQINNNDVLGYGHLTERNDD